MTAVFLVLLWLGLLFFVGLTAAPLLDLILRPAPVRWWFFVPLASPLLLLLWMPILLADPLCWGVIEMVSYLFAWFHFILAGLTLWLGTTLAVVRGLRPGGMTQRRLRTSLAAGLVLVLLGAQPVVLAGAQSVGALDGEWSVLLFWMGFASFAGVVWVLVINRRGPYRLTEGKRWSAALLLASMFQLGLAVAHMVFVLSHAYVSDWAYFTNLGWALITPVLLLLVLGLRFLSGPLPPLPLLVSAASASTLLLPRIQLLLWHPVPTGTELPRWVDLNGDPGPELDINRYLCCARALNGSAPCRASTHFIAAPPQTPLTALPKDPVLVVDDGLRAFEGDWPYGKLSRLSEHDGLAQINGQPERYPLGPELHDALQELGRDRSSELEIARSPRWTAQDYVSICASYPMACKLADYR